MKKNNEMPEYKATISSWIHDLTLLYGHNGFLSAAWYISAVYRDLIMKETGFFPHLFLSGPAATGKTSLGLSLIKLQNSDIISIEKTKERKDFLNRISNIRKTCVLFDEEDITDPTTYSGFRCAYTAIAFSKRIKDGDDYVIQEIPSTSVIWSSQLPFQDTTLYSNTILIDLKQEKFSERKRNLFFEFRKRESIGSYSSVYQELLSLREEIEKKLPFILKANISRNISSKMKLNFRTENTHLGIIMNHTILFSTIELLLGLQISLPYRYLDIITMFRENVDKQNVLYEDGCFSH